MGMGNTGRVCLPRQGKVRAICFNKKQELIYKVQIKKIWCLDKM